MVRLHEVCACKEDLRIIGGMDVTRIEDITDSDGKEGVLIEFNGIHGEKVTLSIMDGAEIHCTQRIRPVYTAQDIRDFEGYIIHEVIGDDLDLNCEVVLKGADGNFVTLELDKAITLESIFIKE